MKRSQWNKSTYPDEMLEFAATFLPEREMRLFACDCVRRVAHLCPYPAFNKVLELAEKAPEEQTEAQIKKVRDQSSKLYTKLFPGHEAPGPAALALTAAGEAAFTVATLQAVLTACENAALAMAVAAGDQAEDDDYDDVHDDAFDEECEVQADLLRKRCEPHVKWGKGK